MSTEPQTGGEPGLAGTPPPPLRRTLTPPPAARPPPRRARSRTLLSGVFALVAFVCLTVALAVLMVRTIQP